MNKLALLTVTLLSLATACQGSSPATSAAAAPSPRAAAPGAVPSLRLYALDCGRVEVPDMGILFSESGKPSGRAGTVTVPCFVVRHPRGVLLWDTGLGDAIAQAPVKGPLGIGEYVDVTLQGQLQTLGLRPEDVTYVGFSHLHADHAGNANLFTTSSTWLLGRKELEWALGAPTPLGVDPKVFSGYKTAKVRSLEGDFDVFGDGMVRILATPGHTPGHQSLALRLARAGTVVLSGDLCHTRANWEHHWVPKLNSDRAQTLSSIDRIQSLVDQSHGRFVVQHAREDFTSLPKFPAFLE
ncbi:N-acyl homoserine lactonase family protein [Pendulispora albinea]|uniref:N-acyl homoserine lactonase family protein n=1 Tax=Pendulispora albinea TaxID=2741071 RepID=A0ABZ2M667_9BACT